MPQSPPKKTSSKSPRVAIVGAGPAGAALAVLCARDGMDVTLFDSNEEVGLGVGESLLPYGHRMWQRLGLSLDDSVLKQGAVFFRNERAARVSFSEAKNCPFETAFQVDRRQLDPRLRELARTAGAKFKNAQPRTAPEGYDWVIDATGRRRVLGRHFTSYRRHGQLQHIALGCHFSGAKLPPECAPGDIGIVGEDGLWFWVIPLPGDLMSIGTVLTGECRKLDFNEAVARSKVVQGCLENATALGRPRGYADYTESAEKFCGPGWGLVGDASMFLDPVFSSGVLFALEGADRMHQVIRGELTPEAYQTQMQDAARMMETVVVAFYSGDFLDMVFCPPELQSDEVRSGLIGLLAGNLFQDTGRGEQMVARRLPGLAALTRKRMPPGISLNAPILQGPQDLSESSWL